ncbi:MAG: nuclear transport factor 2 family protein [Candidatus Acidiferrum sp.]
MKKFFYTYFAGRTIQIAFSLLFGAGLLLACGSPAMAQKKKKTDTPPADTTPALPMDDEQQIDYLISDMLGAWQVGDIQKLQKDYADDVIIVNGIWAPPVFGWKNYLAAYQLQHARMQQIRMDRSNTYIKFTGNFAWACYQWDFSALVDGQPSAARGQTTLIFEKRDNRWVIVHNHTSLAPTAQPLTPANTPQITQPPNGGSTQ